MQSINQIQTLRMSAERIWMAHLSDICCLHHDRDVMKTLSVDGDILSDDQTKDGIDRQITHWEQEGFGYWVFRLHEDGRFVGRGGIMKSRIDDRDEIGLAYAVLSEFWNLGLATEMASTTLDVAFNRLELADVASWTLSVNIASQRVMQKLGFRCERNICHAGLPHRLYRLQASDWKKRRPQL